MTYQISAFFSIAPAESCLKNLHVAFKKNPTSHISIYLTVDTTHENAQKIACKFSNRPLFFFRQEIEEKRERQQYMREREQRSGEDEQWDNE